MILIRISYGLQWKVNRQSVNAVTNQNQPCKNGQDLEKKEGP